MDERRPSTRGFAVLFSNGAPAWMKLITTFPLERYDTLSFRLRMPPYVCETRRSYYD